MTIAPTAAAYSVAAYLNAAGIVAATSMRSARSATVDEDVIERSFVGIPSWEIALAPGIHLPLRTAASEETPIFLAKALAADDLVAEVLAFQDLKEGWDGETAAEPRETAIREARRFIRAAGELSTHLEPTLHVDGSVILEVGNGAEGSLRFKGDGKVTFALQGGRGSLELSDATLLKRIRLALSERI